MSNVITHLSGDPKHGFATDFDLRGAALAQVKLRYSGRYAAPFDSIDIEVEVYRAPDGMLSVHGICPRCGNAFMVTQAQKKIEFDERDERDDKRLRIERFTCKYMMQEARRADMVGVAEGPCNYTCVYDGEVVRDA